MSAGDTGSSEFGVYCHIPFCTHRCDYCAFATWTDRSHLIGEYMASCRRQARDLAADMAQVTSVFFGGGTPNLVPPSMLGDVLGELPLAHGAEITVECNPDLVTPAQMRAFAALGVNRISLGAQSAVEHVLDALGRRHDPQMVAASVDAVRQAGIGRLNIDLIYGSRAESLSDWRRTLAEVIAAAPDHLSAYGLTPEPGTKLGDDPSRHPDDDDMADKYLLADRLLADAGYENYEISNWARPGAQCRHNLLYWRQGAYVGIGCAAHSHRGGRRYWSVRTPQRFIDAIAAGVSPTAGGEELPPAQRRTEALQLALRTAIGVPAGVLTQDVSHLLEPAGPGRVKLNVHGRLLANEVAMHLDPGGIGSGHSTPAGL